MKKILPLLLLAALASGILIYAQTSREPAVSNVNTTAPVTVQVIIDTGDGQPNTYAVANPNPATVFGATQSATSTNNLSFDYDTSSQFGIFITTIADKAGDNQYFWNYKLNGVDGTVAADSQAVVNGDTVTWTYTKIIPQ